MADRYEVVSGEAKDDQDLTKQINDIAGDDFDVVSLETAYVETGPEFWKSVVIKFRVLRVRRD